MLYSYLEKYENMKMRVGQKKRRQQVLLWVLLLDFSSIHAINNGEERQTRARGEGKCTRHSHVDAE